MIIQSPVIAVAVFFSRAFTLMALRKSAASRGSKSDSENSHKAHFQPAYVSVVIIFMSISTDTCSCPIYLYLLL